MKVLIFLALVLAVSATTTDYTHWNNFKTTHGKSYINQIEETKRFAIFQDNLKKIDSHNALYAKGLTTYKLGVTKFADMSHDEFTAMLNKQLINKPKKTAVRSVHKKSGAAPTSQDWRDQAVTNIKDQGTCGSCWAFSTTGSTEGAYAIKTGEKVALSEQQLVDCTTGSKYGNEGCNGGLMDPSFEYIQAEGIESEADYPYEGKDGDCRHTGTSVTKVSGYVDVTSKDEDALVDAVGTVGPVSVAVDATLMQLYIGGIFEPILCSKTILNHGVLAVGYGESDGTDYWLVKNSWGTLWGEDGYIRMVRGKNECGIATEASYPTI